MTTAAQSFRQWLKRLRAAHDLTQDALAERVGSAAQTIRMFESGRRRPSREMAERLADVLGVSSADRSAFIAAARAPLSGTAEIASSATAPAAAAPVSSTAVPPLLATKLYVPRPRADLIRRPRLLAQLDTMLQAPLTLIAAPAGWGKTTLLIEWLSTKSAGSPPPTAAGDPLRHQQPSATVPLHVAWLTLEAGDREPSQLLRYLAATFQSIAPRVGSGLRQLLDAASTPPLETLLPLLLQDLLTLPAPSILVLDDYHVVDSPAAHQVLMFLLEHLPPQLHIVLTTRADPPLPLARLRARGQLAEIRAADLRFTADETAAFLETATGQPFSSGEVAAIAARTEGWIAGIQLAALSLRAQPGAERQQFIDAFTGSHRFVVDYLVDEVLSRQPARLQSFLLQTSILARLCAPLCDAVVAEEAAPGLGGTSQQLLEELERENLFIVPLDDARRWYRYHQLFAQVLQERLARGGDPAAVAALHRRAGDWFEQQGQAADAMHHALTAADWERVVRLITAHGRSLLVNGRVDLVLGWLDALPPTLLGAQPYLLHLRALCLFFTNQPEAAERSLELVEAALAQGADTERSRALRAYASLLHATIARFGGDVRRCVELAGAALAGLPADDVPRRASAMLIVASARVAGGDVSPDSERELQAALRLGRTAGDRSSLLNGLVNLGALQRRQGRLRDARKTYAEALELAPAQGELQTLGNGAAYYFGVGELLLEQNDLAEAQSFLQQGRELVQSALVAEADSIVAGYGALARLTLTLRDADGARALLDELADVARARSFEAPLGLRIAALRARLALQSGDLSAAQRWAESSALDDAPAVEPNRLVEHVLLARVRIAEARALHSRSALDAARTRLEHLLPVARAWHAGEVAIELALLQSLTLHAARDIQGGVAALERALAAAVPAGYTRLVVDEGLPMAALLREALADPGWGSAQSPAGASLHQRAQLLLSLIEREHPAPPVPAAQPVAADTLTPRELEVIRLLAAGSSTAAIAAQLVVAPGTVKRHINNILGKLDAASRLEAVARARTLGLI